MPGFFDPDFFDPAYFGGASLGPGTQQAWVTGKDNKRYGYRAHEGAILGEVYDRAGSSLLGTFTAVASGVDDSGIAADESVTYDGHWRVVLQFRSDGSLVELYSTNAMDFS